MEELGSQLGVVDMLTIPLYQFHFVQVISIFDYVNIYDNTATLQGGGVVVNSPQFFQIDSSQFLRNSGGSVVFQNSSDNTTVFFSIQTDSPSSLHFFHFF